jgi:hypothetical protein
MSLETTLADITAKLRQGKFPSVVSCHVELVETSQSFPSSILHVLQEFSHDVHPESFRSRRMYTNDGRNRCHSELVEESPTSIRHHPSAFITSVRSAQDKLHRRNIPHFTKFGMFLGATGLRQPNGLANLHNQFTTCRSTRSPTDRQAEHLGLREVRDVPVFAAADHFAENSEEQLKAGGGDEMRTAMQPTTKHSRILALASATNPL